MNSFPQFIIAILLLGFVNFSYAQKGKAKLYQNKNPQVAGFYHVLNKTNDSLIIRSNNRINYLYTANNGPKNVRFRVDANEYKMPLNELQKGRNVMVVIQSPLKIVFVITVSKLYPKPLVVASELTAID